MLFSRMIRPAIVAAGAVFATGTIAASPVRAADDLPVVDDIRIEMPRVRVLEDDGPLPPPAYDPRSERYYDERPYAPGPYGAGPSAVIPSSRYARSGPAARPMLPPEQVASVLRASGFSPLGRVTQRSWIYTVAAMDRSGEDGRLIIDARTGQIIRFIPALAVDERTMAVYGPPGPPPVVYAGYENRRGSLLDLHHKPRPPAPVPKVSARSAPKAASRNAQSSQSKAAAASPVPAQQAAAPASPAAAKPVVAESKPAATVGVAGTSAPSTLKLWPTQAMPDVQTLE